MSSPVISHIMVEPAASSLDHNMNTGDGWIQRKKRAAGPPLDTETTSPGLGAAKAAQKPEATSGRKGQPHSGPEDISPLSTQEASQAIHLLLKSSLSHSQGVRELQGILLTTALLPISHSAVQAAQEAGSYYAKQVEANPTGHNLGPPHLQKLINFLEEITEEKMVRKETLEQLTGFLELLKRDKTRDRVHAHNLAPCFKLKSAFKGKKDSQGPLMKITFNVRQDPLTLAATQVNPHVLMLDMFTEIGATIKVGTTPAPGMDKAAQSFLEKMRK